MNKPFFCRNFFLTGWRHKRLKSTKDLLLFYGEHSYGFSENDYMCFWHHATWQHVTIFFSYSYLGRKSYQLELSNLSPSGIYLLKVSNRNTRTSYENCSKLTIKTPERRQMTSFWCLYFQLWTDCISCSSVSTVEFEQANSGWAEPLKIGVFKNSC